MSMQRYHFFFVFLSFFLSHDSEARWASNSLGLGLFNIFLFLISFYSSYPPRQDRSSPWVCGSPWGFFFLIAVTYVLLCICNISSLDADMDPEFLLNFTFHLVKHTTLYLFLFVHCTN